MILTKSRKASEDKVVWTSFCYNALEPVVSSCCRKRGGVGVGEQILTSSVSTL